MTRNLDFNLLRALQALLEERSVTRAAGRLDLSQPAVSGALSKLRRHYHDELLIRVGNNYQLTPLAHQLLKHVAGAVAMADRVFSLQADFDPASSERAFTVAVSDYIATLLGQSLSQLFNDRAPRAQLYLQQLTPDVTDRAPESLRSLDAVVLPHGVLTNLPYQDLLRDEWVCVTARDNTAVGEELTVEDLNELPWVFIYRRPGALSTATRELRIHGVEPRPQIVLDSFAALPSFLIGTNRIALVQRRLAENTPVRVLRCPVPLSPLLLALWWHPSHTADAGHQWLRRLFADAEAAAGHQA